MIYMTEFYLIDLNNITLYTYRSGYYSEEEHKYIWTEMKEYFTKLDIDISDLNRIKLFDGEVIYHTKFKQVTGDEFYSQVLPMLKPLKETIITPRAKTKKLGKKE